MTEIESVIYLASCALNSTIPDKKCVSEMDLKKVYIIAQKHMIGACIAMALESAGYRDEVSARIIGNAVSRAAYYDQAYEEVTKELNQAGIWNTPLKGIVLKDYYPEYGMREMADHDILFDETHADQVREIMEKIGFKSLSFGNGHNDAYLRAPGIEFEMHRTLYMPYHKKEFYDYYKDVKVFLKPEDFYLYLVTHEYKHYVWGGTGLRSLMDIYVYLKKEKLDWEYVEHEARILGIKEFEYNNRVLAKKLFENESIENNEMLSYIVSSGVFGNYENTIKNEVLRNSGSKVRYAINRFLVPINPKNRRYELYAKEFPVFYKYKILLPFLPLYRLYGSIKRGQLSNELKAIWKMNLKE